MRKLGPVAAEETEEAMPREIDLADPGLLRGKEVAAVCGSRLRKRSGMLPMLKLRQSAKEPSTVGVEHESWGVTQRSRPSPQLCLRPRGAAG
jgi:hypothetical protein